mgnify:CR=1 FL=1
MYKEILEIGEKMDVKQLKYFRAIVTEGTISGAAKQLYMTQPSVSQQLHLLEKELDVQLFDRSSRRMTLTEAGRLLNARAEQMLDFLHTTAAEVKELHDGHKGTLLIGTIASAGVTLLPRFLHDYNDKYPHIKIQLFEGDTPRILDLLNKGIIEIGILRTIYDPQHYERIDLPPDPFILAMSPKWDLDQACPSINIKELAAKPILLHRSNEAMFIDYCQKFDFLPNIICKGDDIRTLLVLAHEGVGMALIPKSAAGLIPSNTIRYKEIINSRLVIKRSVIWMKDRYFSSTAKFFIETVLSAKGAV